MSTARENKSLPATVVQSVLLLAAVIAGIMGLGWGLVKVAETQAPGDETNVLADGRIELSMPFALMTGEITFSPSKRPPGPHVERWKNLEDYVEWRFEVPKAGRYRLEVSYASDVKSDEGVGVYEASVAGSKLAGTVAYSGGPDKVRTDKVSEVSFDAPGWYVLTLRPINITPGEDLMRLTGAAFVPVP